MLSDLFADYEGTHIVVAEAIFVDTNDLQNLYLDLEELQTVCAAADDTYDEENEEYNNALEQLKGRFNSLKKISTRTGNGRLSNSISTPLVGVCMTV